MKKAVDKFDGDEQGLKRLEDKMKEVTKKSAPDEYGCQFFDKVASNPNDPVRFNLGNIDRTDAPKITGQKPTNNVYLYHMQFYLDTKRVAVDTGHSLSHLCGDVNCGSHIRAEPHSINTARKNCHKAAQSGNTSIVCPHNPKCILRKERLIQTKKRSVEELSAELDGLKAKLAKLEERLESLESK